MTEPRGIEPDERVGPFDAVRQVGEVLEVLVSSEWAELIDVGGVAASELMTVARRHYGSLWLKRLGEDLPRVFHDAGHQLVTPVEATVREARGERRLLLTSTAEHRQSAVAPFVTVPPSRKSFGAC